ncbi:S8 family serine peptidase [Actinoplanes sp. G11-F43]|uniref:S8 family serine peptidase n=1 Tax=Actinoplanes sp. G11-F43 TaxID=3424130 RepID=UPI003D34A15A
MRASRKAAMVAATTSFAVFSLGTPAHADSIRDSQWHLRYLNISKAHEITKGSSISVAVVDSGVSPHIDLIKNLGDGTDTSSGGDGVGHVDESGHGTAMAGLIAGHGHGSNDGILGIAPDAKILPIKALSSNDSRNTIELGIQRAAELKAKVINVSNGTAQSRSLIDAVETAARADSILIAAAGNSSQAARLGYPAALPEVLAVGAINRSGKVANFSVTGSNIGLCAPGVDIATTDLSNKYVKGRGTSQAAAIVSGAAALVRARFPDLSAPEVVHRLTFTADDNGPPGKDDQCGYGVLNIVEALTADVPPLNAGGATSAQPGVSSAPGGSDVNSTGAVGQAPSESEDAGSDLSALIGVGSVAAVLVGLLAFVTVRKRRTSS